MSREKFMRSQNIESSLPERAIGIMALRKELGISYNTLQKRMEEAQITDADITHLGNKKYLTAEAANKIRNLTPSALVEKVDTETYIAASRIAPLIGCNYKTVLTLIAQASPELNEVVDAKSKNGSVTKRYHVAYIAKLKKEYGKGYHTESIRAPKQTDQKEDQKRNNALKERIAAANKTQENTPPAPPLTEEEKTDLLNKIKKILAQLEALAESNKSNSNLNNHMSQLSSALNDVVQGKKPKNIDAFLEKLQSTWLNEED